MAPRLSRSSLSESKTAKGPAKKNKSRKRTLDAYSIAQKENPEAPRYRRTRLGEAAEDDQPQRKKARVEGDSEEEDEVGNGASNHNKRASKGQFDELGLSEGSDSEGNTWKMGVVDDDDDEELDSDEAFGSSDEEKFSGFTFRGSSGGKGKKKLTKSRKAAPKKDSDHNMGLDEEVSEADEKDEDGFGEDAIDLATMLDQYEASDEDEGQEDGGSSEQDHDDGGEETESESSISDLEDDEENEDKISRLQDLVSSLHPEPKSKSRTREKDPHEAHTPSTSGLISSEKFDIKDILASTSDPQLKAVSKQIGNIPKLPKKDPKLAASLPKRQRDKLDRIAANAKAKETLDRWNDTVKQNRQAEHLTFPLVDPGAAKPYGSKHLLPTSQTTPMNELESAIQSIMKESGLITGNQNEEEERILGFEKLTMNKMPVEEVEARRAELRKARDLMFREEIRAKRIKKIKSKSYRRVHRKEREKLAAMERDAFAEGGENEIDDEQRETADRRRAEERMGAKHRDSKWAKAMKKSGRSVWDDDAKSGVSEMARRNEELRRRIEGKEVQDGNISGDEVLSSSEDSENDTDVDDETEEFRRLQRQLSKVDGPRLEDSVSGLHQMKFMREAEARRAAQNNEDIARMRRELAGEESEQDDEEATIGRKLFGPVKASKTVPAPNIQNEFEEAFESDDEERQEFIKAAIEPTISAKEAKYRLPRNATAASIQITKSQQSKSRQNSYNEKSGKVVPAADKRFIISQPELLPGEKHSQPDADGWVTVNHDDKPSDEEGEDDVLASTTESGLVDQAEILRRAFAGDDVVEAFEKEKRATVHDEDDKVIDDTLPGWGAWVGEGVSKRDQKRNTGRWLRKVEGIKADDRKDRKLKHVIINQKRVKTNVRYLAQTLPFPFTNRVEYERSIRMPIGNEWNVKEVFQESTKPRVLVKAGSIIKPMDKPMV